MSITSVCPESKCRTPIISDGYFVGDAHFRVKCSGCQNLIKVEISRTNKVVVISKKDEPVIH